MRDKDGLMLESLYTNILEGAKKKSKKQVGYLLSDKVSPLSKKQKEKLKKELHSGKVKVEEEVEIEFNSSINEWVVCESDEETTPKKDFKNPEASERAKKQLQGVKVGPRKVVKKGPRKL
jgi:hypothetical protein